MTMLGTRRAATIASCLFIMGQSPHCPKQEYVNYHFDLERCPDDAFPMPDSVVRGEYELYSPNREPRRPCPAFKLYDFVEDRKGFATADLSHPNVYVRLERGKPCRLHVVLVADPEPSRELTQWAETIAQLVTDGSTIKPRIPATMIEKIGARNALKDWCARRVDSGEVSMAPIGSRTCVARRNGRGAGQPAGEEVMMPDLPGTKARLGTFRYVQALF